MNGNKLTKELCLNRLSLFLGLGNMAACQLVRAISGSPYDMIHKFNLADVLPPMWLFNFLSLVFSFLIGGAVGIIVGKAQCYVDIFSVISAYRGGLCYVSLIFLSLIWYPVFFSGAHLWLSLLIALLIVVCSVGCFCFWMKIDAFASLVLAGYGLWSIYILIMNISVYLFN